MGSFSQGRRADDRSINAIKAQVAATHDPLFPFSSPRSELSTPSLTFNDDDDSANDKDEWQSERFSEYSRSLVAAQRFPVERKEGSYKKARPSLQIVTNFSPPQSRLGNIVFNRVAAKQPEQKKNRARSIVSQKGVKVLFTSPGQKESSQEINNLKNLIKSKHEKKSKDVEASAKAGYVQRQRQKRAEQRHVLPSNPRAGVLGLQISDRQRDVVGSPKIPFTPTTPKIIVTPADEEVGVPRLTSNSNKAEYFAKPDSPSSLYSRSISQFYQPTKPKSELDQVQLPDEHQNAGHLKRRKSFESQQDSLTESSDTARPKSQGWWDLMLSPMLSRAGTLKSMRAAEDKDIPPVPPIPNDTDKVLPFQTPMTVMSPETPRRLGLANVQRASWARTMEWEDQRELSDGDLSDVEDSEATVPRDCLDHASKVAALQGSRGEGSAAEYYHACAIEQLADITYFECINHSCAAYRTRLKSIHDAARQGADSALPAPKGDKKASSLKGLLIDIPGETNEQAGQVPLADIEHADPRSLRNEDPVAIAHSSNTPIESELDVGEIVSPNVRKASAAAFTKARTVNSRDPSPVPTVLSAQPAEKKVDPGSVPVTAHQDAVVSPGPLTPEANRSLAPPGALPMAAIQSQPANITVPLVAPVPQTSHALVPPFRPPPHTFIYYPHGQNGLYQVAAPVAYPSSDNHYVPPHLAALAARPDAELDQMAPGPVGNQVDRKVQAELVAKGAKNDSVDAASKSKKTSKRFAGVFCCLSRSKDKKPQSRRRTVIISIVLIVVIVLCILFAIFFSRGNGDANPIDSQWLNLSGFPPMLTGISTIAQPNLAAFQDQCAPPNILWSCALPKEDQAGIGMNQPDQPNFRFQIRFHNGTAGVPANLTIPLNGSESDTSADELFVPNPAAPSLQDQSFLGNTTDNVTAPFEGEPTPFFITFVPAILQQSTANSTGKLQTRDSGDDSDSLNSIPPPSLASDGSAAPVSLLPTTPFPISQPIRLYNRGLHDEHYGFYTYYDKSIFLSSFLVQNGTAVANAASNEGSDANGGSTKHAASARCTWSQTRFLVKMFTNPAFGGKVFPSSAVDSTGKQSGNHSTSSATDFNRPGSFPYPTTVLLDRHGGDINSKLLYCYGMENGTIQSNNKTLFTEFRAFGGVAVNPAPPVVDRNDSQSSPATGGIDGGSGGCGCTWQNWA